MSVLIDCLQQSLQDLWSGRVEVSYNGRIVGQVTLSSGRVAWATCRGQTETLGIFLWRLGRISRDQLAEVQRIFKESQGKKKLGAILEEQGYMSRPVLRRSLLLHARTAIERLLSFPEIEVNMIPGEPQADERFLFGPEEVLPLDLSTELSREWTGPDDERDSWRRQTAQNAILDLFRQLEGYMASAVISYEGDILTGHLRHTDIDLRMTSVLITAMLEASSRTAAASPLSSVEAITLQCVGGTLLACWIDEQQSHLVFVLIDPSGDPGAAAASITEATPGLFNWVMIGKQIESQERIARERHQQAAQAASLRKEAEASQQPEPPRDVTLLGAATPQDVIAAVRRNLMSYVAQRQKGQMAADLDQVSRRERDVLPGEMDDEVDIFSEVRRRALDPAADLSSATFRLIEESDED